MPAIEWVDIGSERMSEARQRLGLSRETASRQLPVSAKTWSRWEQEGRVPASHVREVARILEIKIERAQPVEPLKLSPDENKVLQALNEITTRLDRIERDRERELGILRNLLAGERVRGLIEAGLDEESPPLVREMHGLVAQADAARASLLNAAAHLAEDPDRFNRAASESAKADAAVSEFVGQMRRAFWPEAGEEPAPGDAQSRKATRVAAARKRDAQLARAEAEAAQPPTEAKPRPRRSA